MNFNNHNITALTYNGHSIKRAYSCSGELVFGSEPTPPVPTTDKALIWHVYSGDSAIIKVGNDCNNIDGRFIVRKQSQYALYYIKDCSNTVDYNSLSGGPEYNTYDISCYATATTSAIADYQYANTDLTEVTIISGCSSIGAYAYQLNTKLTDVVFGIPNSTGCMAVPTIVNDEVAHEMVCNTSASTSVTSIGNYAFYGCSNLTYVGFYQLNTVPTLGTNAFANCPLLNRIVVPNDLLDDFKTASGWSQYASIIVSHS